MLDIHTPLSGRALASTQGLLSYSHNPHPKIKKPTDDISRLSLTGSSRTVTIPAEHAKSSKLVAPRYPTQENRIVAELAPANLGWPQRPHKVSKTSPVDHASRKPSTTQASSTSRSRSTTFCSLGIFNISPCRFANCGCTSGDCQNTARLEQVPNQLNRIGVRKVEVNTTWEFGSIKTALSDICTSGPAQLSSHNCLASPDSCNRKSVDTLLAAAESLVLRTSTSLLRPEPCSTSARKSRTRLPSSSTQHGNGDLTTVKISQHQRKLGNSQVPQGKPEKLLPSKEAILSPFFGYTRSRSSSPSDGTEEDTFQRVQNPTPQASPQVVAVAQSREAAGRIARLRGFQGDGVLVGFMDPTRPDIAAEVVANGLAPLDISELEATTVDEPNLEEDGLEAPIDTAMDEAPKEAENGAQEQHNGRSNENGSSEDKCNGVGDGDNSNTGQSGSGDSTGGATQNGTNGGNDGNDEDKKPTPPNESNEMDVDTTEESEVKKEEDSERDILQEKDRLSAIAVAAVSADAGEAMEFEPSSHAASGLLALHHSTQGTQSAHTVPSGTTSTESTAQPTAFSNGSVHSPPAQPYSPSQQNSHKAPSPVPTLPGITDANAQVSSPTQKPTLPSMTSIYELADIAIQQSSNAARTPYSPVSGASPTQASSASSPNQSQSQAQTPVQAGYGSDGARKPVHHMTVQEQRQTFLPAQQHPVYYASTPVPYPQQYPPITEELRTNGSPPAIQSSPYSQAQPMYPASRELPFMNAPSQNYYHNEQPPPIRTGPAANYFAQPPYDSAGPTPGPSTCDTIPAPEEPSPRPMIANASPKRSTRVNRDGTPVQGQFRCEHPGCTAPPFQTQYLLNSHANVHSVARPHFCPVPGCSRGEKGKGFKRKNEMIRHGLVHESPGYVCPFCPEREHKYPRPDNLQRHVRVHHPDKSKDDPQLREVLAQRPEGGSRGRRRRVGS